MMYVYIMMYETRVNVVYFVSYYVITIALVALYAFAMICDNRKLAGGDVVAWFSTPRPDVQFTVHLFLFTFRRHIVPASAPVRVPRPKIPAMFTASVMHVPVERSRMCTQLF